MKILILTDNSLSHDLGNSLREKYGGIEIFQSPNGRLTDVPRLNIKESTAHVIENYGLVISIHCKQLFPEVLVRCVRCVNVHPGYNPHNRGWFPQVFSILNGLPMGVTIHEIDDELDHGPIIAQREYVMKSWDTSGSIYSRIMNIEREMVLEHFESIVEGSYSTHSPPIEGNLNLKRDFDELRELNMDQEGTFRDFLNQLRALTHNEFRNAFFIDEAGEKVFVRVVLEHDKSDNSRS